MKSFVVRSGSVLRGGGRVRRSLSLYDWMFALAGLILVVDLVFPVDVPVMLQYLAYGVVFGLAGAKAVIVRRESQSGEMPPDSVRKSEFLGLTIGVAVMALAVAIQVALALP